MSRLIVTNCPRCGNGKVFHNAYTPDAGEGKIWAIMLECSTCIALPKISFQFSMFEDEDKEK